MHDSHDGDDHRPAEAGFRMADVGAKTVTARRAAALGHIDVGETAAARIRAGTMPKGDPLPLAETAGLMGAKRTSELIPLCHPLPLDHVALDCRLAADDNRVEVTCVVAVEAKTGVEMEALAGVQAALLTVYDLCKPVDPALTIEGSRLLFKEGGKSGYWEHPAGVPEHLRERLRPAAPELPLTGLTAAVVTVSDRAAEGTYEDRSGPALAEALAAAGCGIVAREVVADDAPALQALLERCIDEHRPDLVLTTGGTGLSPRDITPEAVASLSSRTVPGLAELLRQAGARHTPMSWLSRSLAGVVGDSLVITLPGSTRGVRQSLAALLPVLPHACRIVGRGTHND